MLDLERIIEQTTQELAVDPASKNFVKLSDAYRKLGQTEEAIVVAREGLKRHPHLINGHVCLARALFEQGEYPEAKTILEGVVHYSPDHVIALQLLCKIYVELKDKTKGIETLKKYLALAPTDVVAKAQLTELEQMADLNKKAPDLVSPTLAQIYRAQGLEVEAQTIEQKLKPQKAVPPKTILQRSKADTLQALLKRIEERRRAA